MFVCRIVSIGLKACYYQHDHESFCCVFGAFGGYKRFSRVSEWGKAGWGEGGEVNLGRNVFCERCAGAREEDGIVGDTDIKQRSR